MKKIINVITSILVSASLMLTPSLALAQTSKDAVCEGVNFAGGQSSGSCDTTAAASTIPRVVNLGIRLFQMIVGVISVFVIIIAGLSYITSSGDSAKTKTARERIIYAAIGLFVVVLAEVIVRFVLNRVATVAP